MLIYLAENTVNGRRYVGATTATLERRMSEHKCKATRTPKQGHTHFHRAIRKYGWDAFAWRVVERCQSAAAVYEAEQRWIRALGTNKRGMGYNRSEGGEGTPGHIVTAATRAKLSAAGRGRVRSEETRRKLSAALKGRKPSMLAILALSRPRSEETRKRISAALVGRKYVLSEEGRRKRTEARRRAAALGKGAKLHPDEAATIFARRAAGESFRTIGRSYGVEAPTVFYFCKRHRAAA